MSHKRGLTEPNLGSVVLEMGLIVSRAYGSSSEGKKTANVSKELSTFTVVAVPRSSSRKQRPCDEIAQFSESIGVVRSDLFCICSRNRPKWRLRHNIANPVVAFAKEVLCTHKTDLRRLLDSVLNRFW